MICPKCKTDNPDDNIYCKNCSLQLKLLPGSNSTDNNLNITLTHDSPQLVYVIFSLIFPIGWILYIVNKNQKPDAANGYWFASMLASAVLFVVFTIYAYGETTDNGYFQTTPFIIYTIIGFIPVLLSFLIKKM